MTYLIKAPIHRVGGAFLCYYFFFFFFFFLLFFPWSPDYGNCFFSFTSPPISTKLTGIIEVLSGHISTVRHFWISIWIRIWRPFSLLLLHFSTYLHQTYRHYRGPQWSYSYGETFPDFNLDLDLETIFTFTPSVLNQSQPNLQGL